MVLDGCHHIPANPCTVLTDALSALGHRWRLAITVLKEGHIREPTTAYSSPLACRVRGMVGKTKFHTYCSSPMRSGLLLSQGYGWIAMTARNAGVTIFLKSWSWLMESLRTRYPRSFLGTAERVRCVSPGSRASTLTKGTLGVKRVVTCNRRPLVRSGH